VRLASGAIEIETTPGDGVEVELIAHDEESQRLVDDARVELQERSGRPAVLVDVPQRRGFGISFGGRGGVHCRIRCPHESGLSARTKSADVAVRGILGGLNVQTASGGVEADEVTGGANVRGASSDVSIRRVGALNIQTASGDVEVEVATGPVNVQTASGDVNVGEAWDNVNVTTVSGDQHLGAVVTGTVRSQGVSGDIAIGVRRGSRVYLDCTTVSGDTRSELELSGDAPAGDGPELEIHARAVSGDIVIHRAPAPAADWQEVNA
jgi:hypothetical protein